VAATTVSFGLGVLAHDVRLDDADIALQKAEGLLQASQSGHDPGKVQRDFDRHVQKAIQDIEDARAEIVEAGLAADTP